MSSSLLSYSLFYLAIFIRMATRRLYLNPKPLVAVILSDTHGDHRKVEVPEGDIFIHCGDSLKGSLHNPEDALFELNEWLGSLPHRYKILIGGNHDFLLESKGKEVQKYFTHAIYLQDQAVEIEGWKIYGSPFTPKFGIWAFQKPAGKAMKEVWDKIPKDTDILITHGPPKGILDRTYTGKEAGCEMLAQKIKEIRPKYHFFGHIHEAYGTEKKEGTLFLNAALYSSFFGVKTSPTPYCITLTT